MTAAHGSFDRALTQAAEDVVQETCRGLESVGRGSLAGAFVDLGGTRQTVFVVHNLPNGWWTETLVEAMSTWRLVNVVTVGVISTTRGGVKYHQLFCAFLSFLKANVQPHPASWVVSPNPCCVFMPFAFNLAPCALQTKHPHQTSHQSCRGPDLSLECFTEFAGFFANCPVGSTVPGRTSARNAKSYRAGKANRTFLDVKYMWVVPQVSGQTQILC